MTFFSWLKRRDPTTQPPTAVYNAIVARARNPLFYTDLGVPDTIDGRFDLIVLHVMLMVRRLRRDGERAARFSQELLEAMFRDMDRSLREIGVGDMSVGKKVKKMAQAFYGRSVRYDEALDRTEGALQAALQENLYRAAPATDSQLAAMDAYVRATDAALGTLDFAEIAKGRLVWGSDVPLTETA